MTKSIMKLDVLVQALPDKRVISLYEAHIAGTNTVCDRGFREVWQIVPITIPDIPPPTPFAHASYRYRRHRDGLY